jgi:hypothetical protein
MERVPILTNTITYGEHRLISGSSHLQEAHTNTTADAAMVRIMNRKLLQSLKRYAAKQNEGDDEECLKRKTQFFATAKQASTEVAGTISYLSSPVMPPGSIPSR